MTHWPLEEIFVFLIFTHMHQHAAMPPHTCHFAVIMPSFSAEAMVEATMSTGISGLLLLVRNCHASVKMATEPTLSLQRWSEGRQYVPKKISSVCSLYLTLGRLNRLLSNRIHTLLWGFSARPSLFHSRSQTVQRFQNFARKKFSQFKFSHLGVLCEICEILHHMKISHYTVLLTYIHISILLWLSQQIITNLMVVGSRPKMGTTG